MNKGKKNPPETGALSPEGRMALSRLAKDLLDQPVNDKWKQGQSQLLDFLVDQATAGIDLSKAYPEAYQLLLKDAALREAFIDLVEAIEAEKAGDLPELPPLDKIDLDFLKAPSRSVEQTGPGSWRVLLRRTAEELRKLYRPRELAYRSAAGVGEANWLSLVREDIDLNQDTSLAFSLELTRTSSPDELGLFASIALQSAPEEKTSIEYLFDLHVTWGSYKQTIALGENYRAQLPSLPIGLIEEGIDLNQDLEISLNFKQRNKE